MKLAVNEIYGPVHQGEGANLGMPVIFLRLSGCNQACVWCDTPYTWDWTGKNGIAYSRKAEVHVMPLDTIYAKLHTSGTRNLVVTGGEPMLQQEPLFELFHMLKENGWNHIEMETAGTIKPIYFNDIDLFTVSPKLAHSGNARSLSINPDALREFTRTQSVFKFVVQKIEDFDELDDLVLDYDLSPVYVMAEGIDADGLQLTMQEIAEATLERGYYLSPRLQVMLHGNKRAV
ncbi:MAG: 7-carboxy-7-deazaguanine synthase QueE [bacterium]